ncbi:hypothetical protein HaLaN_22269, partial [Haematococcus lacustris]
VVITQSGGPVLPGAAWCCLVVKVALEQQQSTALALAAANHSLEVRLQRQEAAQRDSQLLSERLEAKVAALEQQLRGEP